MPRAPSKRCSAALGTGHEVFTGAAAHHLGRLAATMHRWDEATAHFDDPHILVKVSRGLGDPMPGEEIASLETRLADRGW